ncbi:uncharacterized protein LACBIDRAFT_292793 [Laccaria bicolor S238N-H82]|uniref:Predicted protein n=1 Tax=Laccaria bicolor (strain S238N-H82 / ATCC MYA-4686) TaxID=486041 RepID=B0CXR3_LACBS|nr:uncharacterized protein LACBIDRAFT_292793 [Laccaria bicolor S238N-H82]EDR12767.1 predicted protein [Laccaria bicolor S238N-H82]|eukprot:XP_001877031.1 predicted protein [Laccaria bicolor S238N-H82]
MNHFASAGFNLYSADPSPFTTRPTSPSLSPGSDDRSSIHDFTSAPSHSPKTVLTRSRSGTDTSALSQPRQDISKESLSPKSTSPRSKAHSPTSGEVRILHPDLACVGWSDELAVDSWGLKIIKLVAFPDLIPLSPQRPSSPLPFSPPPLDPFAPVSVSDGGLASSSSSSSDSEDDGYFSHSPQNVSVTSLDSLASRSYTDLPSLISPSPLKPPSKHPLSPETPLSPRKATRSHAHAPTPPIRNEVLFFSFTRTQEGSSLTADVHILATLFPPNERHMVMCSGELDAADADSSDDDEDCDTPSPRKCLQLDLRRFGLNKHGLVNHFSRVLEENGINHMYSSTFKTANLLVDKKHALRAQSLLRVC